MNKRLTDEIAKYSKTTNNTIICYEINNGYPRCIAFSFNGKVNKLLVEIPLFINKLIYDILINYCKNDRDIIEYLLRKELIKSI